MKSELRPPLAAFASLAGSLALPSFIVWRKKEERCARGWEKRKTEIFVEKYFFLASALDWGKRERARTNQRRKVCERDGFFARALADGSVHILRRLENS